MDDLERELKRELAREDPPAWFEARVLAAVERERVRPVSWWRLLFAQHTARWATACAALVITTAGVWEHQRAVQERQAGEAAKQKLEMALRITSTKLQRIQAKVDAIGVRN